MMKFQFERDDLISAIDRIAAVVEKKSTMPILSNILIEVSGDRVALSATDLEIGIRSECDVKVLGEGKACVPARSLADIVRDLPDKSGTLRKGENEWVLLESGRAQFRVVGMSAEEFPQMLGPSNFRFTKIPTSTLHDMFERTAFAISTDEIRYNLNGAYLEMSKAEKGGVLLRVVATDGHRLAMAERKLEGADLPTLKKGVILPRKGIVELRRLLSERDDEYTEMALTDTHAAFRFGPSLLYMRLIVGEFPDYTAVIPKTGKRKLMANRDQFIRSLKRVSLLAEGKSRCVRFGFSKNGILLAANSPELGEAEETIQAEYEGADLQIGFNAKYLLDALTAIGGDQITLELDHEQSPGLLQSPSEKGFLSVVMPMRI